MIEQEADNAEVGLSLWEIGIGAGGHARRENFRIDDEVERRGNASSRLEAASA